MKAFEKWWDEAIQPSERIHDCSSAYTSMEIGWRAALKWAQLRFEFGSKVAYSTDDILMAVKKEIREELEDE